ncbi:MAG: GPR endopeptidase, partial [Oscillospiraceae bacterium]|nr:GPR endopeptidase [Oscillospiraceae bacterium]
MNFRTDLAVERRETLGAGEIEGITSSERVYKNAKITEIEVLDERGSAAISKPKGKYVTIDVPSFSSNAEILDGRQEAVTEEIKKLLPEGEGLVFIAGLGNNDITP